MAMDGTAIRQAVPGVVADALSRIAKEQGFRKPRYHVASGSNEGDGYTSDMYRVAIRDEEGPESGGPREVHVMCKTTFPTPPPFMRFLFVAEGFAYSSVLPALEEVARLTDSRPWPRCLHVLVDSTQPCLVLEDLGTDGFGMADRHVPLDVQHCRLALSQLARLHGAAMALQHLRPDQFRAVRVALNGPLQTADFREKWRSYFVACEESPDMMVDRFPAGSEVHTKLKEFFSTFFEYFLANMLTPDEGPGNALVHGDCHVNNMLFQYDKGSGAVTGCRLIDFQTAHCADTALDLSTLLLGCTDKAMRDQHWGALLRGYHAELQATLRAAGCEDPDAIYSWQLFLTRLGSAARYGLFTAPLLLHALAADPAAIKELRASIDVLNAEGGAADAAAGNDRLHIQWTPRLKQRFGDLVEDMLAWGWL